ncbi:MAG: FxsA family protein [Planctomycetota bacterium]
MILLRLLLLFTLVPMLELFLLLRLAAQTSPSFTFALVVITGVIGSYVAKREGLAAWMRIRDSMSDPRHGITEVGRDVSDAIMIAFAAALLVTPGILTDVVGFSLLVPAGRRLFRQFVLPRLFAGVSVHTHFGSEYSGSRGFDGSGTSYHAGGEVIDGDARTKEEASYNRQRLNE